IAVKSITALSFVLPNYVYSYYCKVQGLFDNNGETRKFIKYMVTTWLGPKEITQTNVLLEGNALAVDHFIRQWIAEDNLENTEALFSIRMWNSTNRLAHSVCRTNNSIEAFFRVWNTYLRPNPCLSKF